MLSSKKWLICFSMLTVVMLVLISAVTVIADPFFHYHAPDTERFYYSLDNERSQNDGTMRHFTYDGLITGTSMTQNFKTTEAEALGSVLKNERYVVREEQDGWVRVTEDGWVSGEFVTIRRALNVARKLDLRSMVLNMYDNLGVSEVQNYLNIREEPKEDGQIIGKLTSKAGCDILETDGELTVMPFPEYQPAAKGDLGAALSPAGLYYNVISDGVVLPENLRRAGLDRAWLKQELARRCCRVGEVFLLAVDGNGRTRFVKRERR